MNQKIHTNEILKMCDKIENIKKKNWEIIEKTEAKIEEHKKLVSQYQEEENKLFYDYVEKDILTAKRYSKIYQDKVTAENKKNYHYRRMIKLSTELIEMKNQYQATKGYSIHY